MFPETYLHLRTLLFFYLTSCASSRAPKRPVKYVVRLPTKTHVGRTTSMHHILDKYKTITWDGSSGCWQWRRTLYDKLEIWWSGCSEKSPEKTPVRSNRAKLPPRSYCCRQSAGCCFCCYAFYYVIAFCRSANDGETAERGEMECNEGTADRLGLPSNETSRNHSMYYYYSRYIQLIKLLPPFAR